MYVDFERAEHGQVDVAAANHREGFGGRENRCANTRGHRLFAGVDHVGVDLIICRESAHAEQAVFRLQHDFHAFGNVVGNQGRNADAQVHVVAVLHFAGDALSHLFAGKSHFLFSVVRRAGGVDHLRTVRCSMRFSNVPQITRST